MNVIEGNILIADFLGWENYGDGKTYKFPNLYPLHNIDSEHNSGWISEQISDARFHSSWDWQIPVYSKLWAEMFQLEMDRQHETNQELVFQDHYIEAVINNSPAEGFKIIIKNLKWLQSQKQPK